MRMRDRIGIVTGGSTGMGRAGALRLAAEGAAVTVVARNPVAVGEVVAAIHAAGGRALGLPGDLADEAFARRIVTATAQHFGGLDFVWNNVGEPGPSRFEGLDLAEFDAAINLNVRTAIATTTEALPHLRRRGGGSVLFTASFAGLRGSPFAPVYSTAKFGLVGLTRSLAKRYARENIRINVLCPGTTDTPMLRVFVARPDQEATRGQDPEELIRRRSAENPMRRIGRPEEVANAALFLLSDEASFITGIALPVDGGASA